VKTLSIHHSGQNVHIMSIKQYYNNIFAVSYAQSHVNNGMWKTRLVEFKGGVWVSADPWMRFVLETFDLDVTS
jgi:hypothetical protein